MFSELQIRRPTLAAVYLGLFLAMCMALNGAAMGKPLGEILVELPVSVFVATVVGAAMNKRMRSEDLAGLTAEQMRQVVRWVRRGEVVQDRVVAEAVIVYVQNQDRIEPWGTACMSLITVFALSLMITGDGGVNSVALSVTLLVAFAAFLVDQRFTRRRRRVAEAAARSQLDS